MRNLDPWKDEKPGIVHDSTKILDSLLLGPSQITISTPNVTRSRTPPQTGYYPTPSQGKILQMFSYRSSVSQVVILFDEAVIELLQRSPSDLTKFNGSKLR
jgi:hypothetical protein